MPVVFATIVEGYGDVQAIPALISKAGLLFGESFYAPKPIRVGEWKKFRRPGEMERYIELALSRQPDRVLAILDLDDGCAVDEAQEFYDRALIVRGERGTAIDICFCVKEYEAWFLCCADHLFSTDSNLFDVSTGEEIRGAKERVSALMDGHYKETTHQLQFTRQIPFDILFGRSRSFRHFLTISSDRSQEQIDASL